LLQHRSRKTHRLTDTPSAGEIALILIHKSDEKESDMAQKSKITYNHLKAKGHRHRKRTVATPHTRKDRG